MIDLRQGFVIDRPAVFVKWDISEAELEQLLRPVIRNVTNGYWTAPVEVLGGLKCNLGFHFRGNGGALSELEFFRSSYTDQKGSFEEFQSFFVHGFGLPTEQHQGSEGFPNYRWLIPGAEIVHMIFDRFGPEEHMRIRHR